MTLVSIWNRNHSVWLRRYTPTERGTFLTLMAFHTQSSISLHPVTSRFPACFSASRIWNYISNEITISACSVSYTYSLGLNDRGLKSQHSSSASQNLTSDAGCLFHQIPSSPILFIYLFIWNAVYKQPKTQSVTSFSISVMPWRASASPVWAM